MRRERKQERGFTLVEMMIALVLAAIVIAPLYIITRSMAGQTDFQRMEVEAMQRARTGLNLLARDFARAGLFTSPNTGIDTRFMNKEMGGTAQYRAAVVHLNRLPSTPLNDAVLITGNLYDSRAFTADFEGSQFRIYSIQENDCTTIFDSNYSFALITNRKGQSFESKIAEVTANGPDQECLIRLVDDPTTQNFIATAEPSLRISANQTALFWVENGQLVRYFINYNSTGPTGNCAVDPSDLTAANLDGSNIDGTVLTGTRRVLADNVVSFQVWFRAKTESVTDNTWNLPHYDTLANITAAAGGNYSEGLLPPDAWQVIPATAGDVPASGDVSCAFTNPSIVNPASVRSAVVKLAVRTDIPDYQLSAPSASDGRLVRNNLVAGADQSAYKVMTLVTEIEMPNLAARSDL